MKHADDGSLEARITRLEKRKKEADTRLAREKGKLRQQQRRERDRRLRRFGELLELSELDHLTLETLLGIFLEAASRTSEQTVTLAWQERGQRFVAERGRQPVPAPCVILGQK